MKTFALVLMAGALWATPVRATSLIVNGNFETGDTTGWTRFPATPPGGGTLMAVQTANNGCGQGSEFPLPCRPAHTGLWDMAFGGDMNLFDSLGLEDVLSQTISTITGQTYALNFWMAQDSPGSACCYNEFRVFWNGNPVLSTRNLRDGNYIDYQLLLVATGPTSTLAFGSMNLPGWNRLDDVQLNVLDPVCVCVFDEDGNRLDVQSDPVPEPATLTLLALGLVVVGYRRRRLWRTTEG